LIPKHVPPQTVMLLEMLLLALLVAALALLVAALALLLAEAEAAVLLLAVVGVLLLLLAVVAIVAIVVGRMSYSSSPRTTQAPLRLVDQTCYSSRRSCKPTATQHRRPV
jgi:hypothetical protein